MKDILRIIIKRYNSKTQFCHERIRNTKEEVHYKVRTLRIELLIVCTMYETEKRRRMYINLKMSQHCPLLLGATGNELLHEYIWKNNKTTENERVCNTWLVDKEIDGIMRRYQKSKATYRMNKAERVLNILPNINYKDKQLILNLKYDSELLIDMVIDCLKVLKKETNMDDELINKYREMMN